MPLKSIILQLAATAFTACRAVSAFSRRPPYGGRAALPKADTAAMANVVVQNAYGMYSLCARCGSKLAEHLPRYWQRLLKGWSGSNTGDLLLLQSTVQFLVPKQVRIQDSSFINPPEELSR